MMKKPSINIKNLYPSCRYLETFAVGIPGWKPTKPIVGRPPNAFLSICRLKLEDKTIVEDPFLELKPEVKYSARPVVYQELDRLGFEAPVVSVNCPLYPRRLALCPFRKPRKSLQDKDIAKKNEIAKRKAEKMAEKLKRKSKKSVDLTAIFPKEH